MEQSPSELAFNALAKLHKMRRRKSYTWMCHQPQHQWHRETAQVPPGRACEALRSKPLKNMPQVGEAATNVDQGTL